MDEQADAVNPAIEAGDAPDLTYLHPDHVSIGSTGIFAGDWAWTDTDVPRIPMGFVGLYIDTWNGWAVFSCTRDVAEAIVADQERLRDLERVRLSGQGHAGEELTRMLDEAIAPMYFDGDEIVLDERRSVGHDVGLSRLAPDTAGRYIVNGWHWTWT